MKVDKKGHTTILKETKGNVLVFLENITAQHQDFKDQNLILDLSHDPSVTIEDLMEFKNFVDLHKKEKKSIVIVVDKVDFNAVPEELTVVPSLLEAHDIIEMEEIERDLGF